MADEFMTISAAMDLGDLEERLDGLAKLIGVSARFIAYDQMRLFVNGVMKWTPPKTMAQGRNAVRHSLGKLFSPCDLDFETFMTERFITGQQPTPAGTIVDFSGSRSRIEDHHMRYRGSKGRVRYKRVTMQRIGAAKIDNVFYLRKQDYKDYEREQFAKVGRLKAGWIPCADYWADKARASRIGAAWVRKNAKREGQPSGDIDDNGNGEIVSTNQVPYASKKVPRKLVIQEGIRRERDMRGALVKRIDQLVERFNRVA